MNNPPGGVERRTRRQSRLPRPTARPSPTHRHNPMSARAPARFSRNPASPLACRLSPAPTHTPRSTTSARAHSVAAHPTCGKGVLVYARPLRLAAKDADFSGRKRRFESSRGHHKTRKGPCHLRPNRLAGAFLCAKDLRWHTLKACEHLASGLDERINLSRRMRT